MPYLTKEEIQSAREIDLFTFMKNYAPDRLVQVSGDTYCTADHDSLRISNGKWYWFSRNVGGRSALDYLVKVEEMPFVSAVQLILGKTAVTPPQTYQEKKREVKVLVLPEANGNNDKVRKYLQGRGIHSVIIDYCIENKLLYEAREYHNAVFLGYDESGKARYGSVRATKSAYKGELTGSDKHFSFSIPAQSGDVHVFESAIDLLSYATMELYEGRDWKRDSLLSLAGVFQTKRSNVVPIALSQFLSQHPEVKTIHLHLDNDEVGRGAVAGIVAGLNDKYQVLDEPPKQGKDVNDTLKMRVKIKEKEDYAR